MTFDWQPPQEPDWGELIREIGFYGRISRTKIAGIVGTNIGNLDRYCSGAWKKGPSYALGARLLSLRDHVRRETR